MDTKDTRQLKCCICREPIETEAVTNWAGGHNAEPVMAGRCCRNCNDLVVVPTRIRRIYRGA